MRSNDRRHCLQNCVAMRRKTGTVINYITSKSNGIKLVHLNARSLKNREHLAQIKELVNDENVDVLAVSESWLKSSTTNAEVEIPGYEIYRLDRKHKKGGGVCIYVQKEFKVTMLKNFSYISTSDFHQLWLQIQVRQHKSFIICVAYRPRDSQVTCIREELKPRCIEALLKGKQVVVMGDLNCNLLNPGCSEAKVLIDTCSELKMTQLVKYPIKYEIKDRQTPPHPHPRKKS